MPKTKLSPELNRQNGETNVNTFCFIQINLKDWFISLKSQNKGQNINNAQLEVVAAVSASKERVEESKPKETNLLALIYSVLPLMMQLVSTLDWYQMEVYVRIAFSL